MEANWSRIEQLVWWRQNLQRIINYRLEVVSRELMEFVMGWPAVSNMLAMFSKLTTEELVYRKSRVEEELDFMLERVCYHY